MIATYTRMGMSDLATDSRQVLTQNFPSSAYLEQSNSEIARRGFFSRLLRRGNTQSNDRRVTATDTAASNVAVDDDRPGFFGRLFGRDSND